MEQALAAIYTSLMGAYPNSPCVKLVEEALAALRAGDLSRACRLLREALNCLQQRGIAVPPALQEWLKLYCGNEPA